MGHVSIADRVGMQAAVARTVADPVLRAHLTMLYNRVTGVLAFDWQDAETWLAKLDTLALPGEPVEIVSLKASLRAWATMGRDRARAVAS